MEIDIGIKKNSRKKIADKLKNFLADTYAIYLKTQNFHWNLVGSNFYSLHILFEKQYKDMADAVDEIAERIRSLGFLVPGSFAEFKKLSIFKEAEKILKQDQMIKILTKDHELIAKLGKPILRFAQDEYDDITSDMIIKRITFHEKTAWMLRSHLEK
jgi:starvation-inducible DNA-binding protein